MKKLLFTSILFFGMILTTFANTIELKNNIKIQGQLEIELNLEEISDEEIYNYESSAAVAIPRSIFDQINYCAQVQMDVKETYTEIFGPDRANSIALGAFMGCMGWL